VALKSARSSHCDAGTLGHMSYRFKKVSLATEEAVAHNPPPSEPPEKHCETSSRGRLMPLLSSCRGRGCAGSAWSKN